MLLFLRGKEREGGGVDIVLKGEGGRRGRGWSVFVIRGKEGEGGGGGVFLFLRGKGRLSSSSV